MSQFTDIFSRLFYTGYEIMMTPHYFKEITNIFLNTENTVDTCRGKRKRERKAY